MDEANGPFLDYPTTEYSPASDNLCLFPAVISVPASPRFCYSPRFLYGQLNKSNIDN